MLSPGSRRLSWVSQKRCGGGEICWGVDEVLRGVHKLPQSNPFPCTIRPSQEPE